MKKEPYLYVVSFSDFSMDSLSGYFGGEIRLAYLFDGEKVTPVTGGSVSGNLLELQKDMAFDQNGDAIHYTKLVINPERYKLTIIM